jgi:hypothetical protein
MKSFTCSLGSLKGDEVVYRSPGFLKGEEVVYRSPGFFKGGRSRLQVPRVILKGMKSEDGVVFGLQRFIKGGWSYFTKDFYNHLVPPPALFPA